MFFIKNETSCSIQSLMRPLLWLAQVLAKLHQEPHTDPQLPNLSSRCCLFLPAPYSQCPKMTFLNRVRCFRSSLSRLLTLSFFFFLFFLFFRFLVLFSLYLFIFIPFETPTNLDLLSTPTDDILEYNNPIYPKYSISKSTMTHDHVFNISSLSSP